MKRREITPGMIFGRLTVITEAIQIKRGLRRFNCICKCGNHVNVSLSDILYGNTKSCGCLAKELQGKRALIHGKHKTRLYIIWTNMKGRCLNPNNPRYKDWGGRGIQICKRWMNFQGFYSWALSSGYSDDLTIERIDNNGDYSPKNCTWISKRLQNRNTRTNRLITYSGITRTLQEWSDILGISRCLLAARIGRLRWSIEKAFNVKVRHFTKRKEI